MNSSELFNKINAAQKSSAGLLDLDGKTRKKVLLDLSVELVKRAKEIMSANKKDIANAKKDGKKENFIERLAINQKGILLMADSIKIIAHEKDILFEKLEERIMPSGIKIQKVRVPLGLVGIIFESRPNVTVDAFALTFKSGNGVILKGGKEIKHTNAKLVSIIKKILTANKINPQLIHDISGINRSLIKDFVSNKMIDCLIPRGGKNLIDFVKNNAEVPVIITGASVVHTYIDESADIELAEKVIFNAKTRRVSICNALDVILLHEKIYTKFLNLIKEKLIGENIELRADRKGYTLLKKLNYPNLKLAGETDFDAEFLDYILAVKIVKNFSQALEHIKKHGLGHSEAIITKSDSQAKLFFRQVDAACLYLNTSTQFSDGGEFGLGGEIGISTQKLHARGPFAFKELTTYKYIISSKGAIRK